MTLQDLLLAVIDWSKTALHEERTKEIFNRFLVYKLKRCAIYFECVNSKYLPLIIVNKEVDYYIQI
jgi:hypothetical protein